MFCVLPFFCHPRGIGSCRGDSLCGRQRGLFFFFLSFVLSFFLFFPTHLLPRPRSPPPISVSPSATRSSRRTAPACRRRGHSHLDWVGDGALPPALNEIGRRNEQQWQLRPSNTTRGATHCGKPPKASAHAQKIRRGETGVLSAGWCVGPSWPTCRPTLKRVRRKSPGGALRQSSSTYLAIGLRPF